MELLITAMRRSSTSRTEPGQATRVVVVCLAALLASPLHPVLAQGVSEPALKAAFLLNVAKFTEWPDEGRAPTAPLALCSADPAVGTVLERTVTGQAIGQHPLTATRVTLDAPLKACALLYVGKVDRDTVAELAVQLRGSGVLTVGDDQAFASGGGMIGLFVEDGRMRFAVNIGATERGRVRLSAKLLSLARIVKE